MPKSNGIIREIDMDMGTCFDFVLNGCGASFVSFHSESFATQQIKRKKNHSLCACIAMVLLKLC